MLLTLFLLLIGFVILIKGADFLVNGASSLAKKFNISNLAIGLTVVAFGTSMPELIVNIIASTSGKNDAAFGNVVGSNIFNLMFILGICGMITPLVVQRNTIAYEVPMSLVAALLLLLLVNDVFLFDAPINVLSTIDGFVLLGFFILFTYYVYRSMKSGNLDESGDVKQYTVGISILLALVGLGMLVGGGQLVVDNAVKIAEYFGLSERLIGLTILAAGTSLPELATSAVAAYKKNTDIAIGNVVGSNIFNIFFILGVTGLITPVKYNIALNFDLILLLAATVILIIFMFTLHRRKLDRWEAFMLFVGYLVYTVYLVFND